MKTTTAPSSKAIAMVQDSSVARVHMWLCHSDGTECADGCEKLAIRERLAEYEAAAEFLEKNA